jgi:hypothetical protein
MFSVYGRAGRVFRGSMEDLRKVGAASALMRSRRVAPVGQDTHDMTHPVADAPTPNRWILPTAAPWLPMRRPPRSK